MRRLIRRLVAGKEAPFNFGLWTGLLFGFAAYMIETWWVLLFIGLMPVLVELERIGKGE